MVGGGEVVVVYDPNNGARKDLEALVRFGIWFEVGPSSLPG